MLRAESDLRCALATVSDHCDHLLVSSTTSCARASIGAVYYLNHMNVCSMSVLVLRTWSFELMLRLLRCARAIATCD